MTMIRLTGAERLAAAIEEIRRPYEEIQRSLQPLIAAIAAVSLKVRTTP